MFFKEKYYIICVLGFKDETANCGNRFIHLSNDRNKLAARSHAHKMLFFVLLRFLFFYRILVLFLKNWESKKN